jgi:hypothetical protein
MLDEVADTDDVSQYVRDLLDRGERIMGFGHRVYRAEDPRARVLRGTARELESSRVEVAEALEQAALDELAARHPDRVLATNVEFWSAVVLDIADIPPPLFPALFACARVAGWSAHILEQMRTGRLIRPSAKYVGPAPARSRRPVDPRLPPWPAPPQDGAVTLAEAVALAGEAKDERALADLRREVGDDLEAAARSANYQERAVAYRAIGQLRFNQKTELLRRGLEDTSPACRGSALLSLELLSRDHPGLVNGSRPLLHSLANDDPNPAVRRLAVLSLKNGSPTPDTITLLAHLGEEADARDLRQTATAVHQALKKRAAAR